MQRIKPLLIALMLCLGISVYADVSTLLPMDYRHEPVQYINANGIKIAYRSIGNGPALLMIPGLTMSMDLWDPQFISALSKKFHVVMIDNRGAGYTSNDKKELSIDLMAKDDLAFLEAMHMQKADVLGYSMGSFIAQTMAVTSPQSINHLIIYSGHCGRPETASDNNPLAKKLISLKPDSTEARQAALKVLLPPDWLSKPMNKLKIGYVFANNKDKLTQDIKQQQYQAIKSWAGVCNDLSKIQLPTLIMQGDSDQLITMKDGNYLASHIPGSWLVRIKDGGHGMMYQYPQSMAKQIILFANFYTKEGKGKGYA